MEKKPADAGDISPSFVISFKFISFAPQSAKDARISWLTDNE